MPTLNPTHQTRLSLKPIMPLSDDALGHDGLEREEREHGRKLPIALYKDKDILGSEQLRFNNNYIFNDGRVQSVQIWTLGG